MPHARAPHAAPTSSGGIIQSIKIEGAQRIEEGTIRSYILLRKGDAFDADRIDRSLKTLYSTGLFQDVQLTRVGDTLVVKVIENPLVNRVAFENNHKLGDDVLRPEMQLRPRSVFTAELAEADRQKILSLYAKKGYYDAKVESKVIHLDQNRVDVVFQVNEGAAALIGKIVVNGNKAFPEQRLLEVINSRESRWWRFLSSSDQYDSERLSYDKELLRRFYLKNGYADIQVMSGAAELAPDRKSFFLSFTVNEGARYKVGKVSINSQIHNLNGSELQSSLELHAGDWYDGDAVTRIADKMDIQVHNLGFAFVEVKPRVKRDTDKHTIDLTFDVGEGLRVYVERIDIVGNSRTQDHVIRREFSLAEGDAYSSEAVRRTKTKLTDMGYFQGVDITTNPGSTPDKAILTTTINEKATGELSFGGGYSTDAGALLNVGLTEKNLVGSGMDAAINGTLAQYMSSLNTSLTDPYFLDRNLVATANIFFTQSNYFGVEPYNENRLGFTLSQGYAFNDYLSQNWSYTAVDRQVYAVQYYASPYIAQEAGSSVMSEISNVTTFDFRDSKIQPSSGSIFALGADYAGIGGTSRFIRGSLNAAYYIPLVKVFGDPTWVLKFSGYVGDMVLLPGGKEQIIDRFYLGGDNLRGFFTGGAGPHDLSTDNPLGGRFIYTQSTEMAFPLPVSPDLGVNGRTFLDIGGLLDSSFRPGACVPTFFANCAIQSSPLPRAGAGVGISWRTAFGLINIDLTPFVYKQPGDQTEIFRFGFGTRF